MFRWIVFTTCLIALVACQNGDAEWNAVEVHGIKPYDELKLAPIDDSLVQQGIRVFETRCSKCHRMELQDVGPDISDLLARRKPAWVLNFIVNTKAMIRLDSLAYNTRSGYKLSCSSNLKPNEAEEAFAILEYLRMYQIWLHEINVPKN